MNKHDLLPSIAGLALAASCGLANAQSEYPANIVKLGASFYTTHAKTDGVSGIGVPAGADVDIGNATTLLLTYERLLTSHIGVELAIGIPPRIHADAAGSVAFLGKDVLSARFVAPTAFVNYHFFDSNAALRPYLGIGVNYTRFTGVRSTLANDVKMGDSWGVAGTAGLDYVVTRNIGLFASVARLDVKSNVVAAGANVLTTKVDFRPLVFNAGISYRF